MSEQTARSSNRLSELTDASESRFSWSEPGCSSSGSLQARSSLKKNRKRHLRIMQCGHLWDFFYIYILLLLDRLDPFHQVSLSFSVWIQGLVLRYNTKVRSWLLPNLVSKQIPTSTQDNEINRFKLFSFWKQEVLQRRHYSMGQGSLDSVLEGWCLT